MSFASEREVMVARQLIPRGITNERVLAAMRKVPREKFVPEAMQELAYYDGVLPIGGGQTISQPYMIARMVELLEPDGTEKTLEVGAGSGYQAAVLAECVKQVYTLERLPGLVALAKNNLKSAGYNNVEVLEGDGTLGYPPQAPYDAIIVAAAAPEVPEALRAQLAEGGRLVIPVGDRTVQQLVLIKKVEGMFRESYSDRCVFVPLIGKAGWAE